MVRWRLSAAWMVPALTLSAGCGSEITVPEPPVTVCAADPAPPPSTCGPACTVRVARRVKCPTKDGAGLAIVVTPTRAFWSVEFSPGIGVPEIPVLAEVPDEGPISLTTPRAPITAMAADSDGAPWTFLTDETFHVAATHDGETDVVAGAEFALQAIVDGDGHPWFVGDGPPPNQIWRGPEWQSTPFGTGTMLGLNVDADGTAIGLFQDGSGALSIGTPDEPPDAIPASLTGDPASYRPTAICAATGKTMVTLRALPPAGDQVNVLRKGPSGWASETLPIAPISEAGDCPPYTGDCGSGSCKHDLSGDDLFAPPALTASADGTFYAAWSEGTEHDVLDYSSQQGANGVFCSFSAATLQSQNDVVIARVDPSPGGAIQEVARVDVGDSRPTALRIAAADASVSVGVEGHHYFVADDGSERDEMTFTFLRLDLTGP